MNNSNSYSALNVDLNIFFETISTREKATILWLGLFLAWALKSKDVRSSIWKFIKACLNRHIIGTFLYTSVYTFYSIQFLNSVNLWDHLYLKDALIWYFSSFILIMKNIGVSETKVLVRNIFKEYLELTLIVSILLSVNSFSLLAELFIVPCVTFVVIIKVFAERDVKYKDLAKFFSYLEAIIGICFIYIVVHELNRNSLQGLKEEVYKTVVLFCLSSLFLPSLYLLVVYGHYSTIYNRIDYFIKEPKLARYMKIKLFLYCHFRIARLSRGVEFVRLCRNVTTKQQINEILK